MPQAWHRSGLCFFCEFEQVDEHGTWSWVVWDDDISQSRLEELRAELGDELFFKFTAQLGRQAKARWHELGYNDWSLPTGVPRPASGKPAVTEAHPSAPQSDSHVDSGILARVPG